MKLKALNPDHQYVSLYVDEDGALLVATDDTSNPLPVGAVPAKSLLVNADGELVVSTS
jgi:hypothetical protein